MTPISQEAAGGQGWGAAVWISTVGIGIRCLHGPQDQGNPCFTWLALRLACATGTSALSIKGDRHDEIHDPSRGVRVIGGRAALLLCAPIAGADDPPACDQSSDQNDQQCQDQQKGAGIANQAVDDAKKAADQAKQGVDRAQRAADQAKQGADQAKQGADQGQKAIDLSDKNCWLINGVPTMWTPALSTGPGQTAVPCYSAYGLKPH